MTPTNYGAVNMQSLFLLGSLRHLHAVQPRTNMSSDGWLIDLFLPCSLECFLERQDDIMFLGPEGIVTFWRIYNEMILCVYILMFVCLSNYLLIFIYSYTHIYIYKYIHLFFYTHIYTYSNGGTCSIATVLGHFLASNSSFHTFSESPNFCHLACGWQGYRQHQPSHLWLLRAGVQAELVRCSKKHGRTWIEILDVLR